MMHASLQKTLWLILYYFLSTRTWSFRGKNRTIVNTALKVICTHKQKTVPCVSGFQLEPSDKVHTEKKVYTGAIMYKTSTGIHCKPFRSVSYTFSDLSRNDFRSTYKPQFFMEPTIKKHWPTFNVAISFL